MTSLRQKIKRKPRQPPRKSITSGTFRPWTVFRAHRSCSPRTSRTIFSSRTLTPQVPRATAIKCFKQCWGWWRPTRCFEWGRGATAGGTTDGDANGESILSRTIALQGTARPKLISRSSLFCEVVACNEEILPVKLLPTADHCFSVQKRYGFTVSSAFQYWLILL